MAFHPPALDELVARNGEAVLLLGLDPLPQSADAARVDTYLDDALAGGWLLFGLGTARRAPGGDL
ncbi:hypothetical protein [Streptomyces sviceus]|uniref:hypothetical protein n=1 Tax=Streptomyces sviceus TaxID=285530 RepID=UPI0036E2E003